MFQGRGFEGWGTSFDAKNFLPIVDAQAQAELENFARKNSEDVGSRKAGAQNRKIYKSEKLKGKQLLQHQQSSLNRKVISNGLYLTNTDLIKSAIGDPQALRRHELIYHLLVILNTICSNYDLWNYCV